MNSSIARSTARAPGKVILFGEHAINRGQPAIAAAVGLYAQCEAAVSETGFLFEASGQRQQVTRDQILHLLTRIEAYRADQQFDRIRDLARSDYFAPQKFILGAMFGDALPQGLSLRWTSELSSGSGLGSGGAAFVSMVCAVTGLMSADTDTAELARLAQLGDVIAHGGIASGLDTQTSLIGGLVRFDGHGMAQSLACGNRDVDLVIGHTGVSAPTSEVNSKVRRWLSEDPDVRIHAFNTVGTLSRAAERAMAAGDWDEVGRLMNLNQLVLDRVGVNSDRSQALIDRALRAGALGAKVSGSGGGGIVVALTPVSRKADVVAALRGVAKSVYEPAWAVAGASQLAIETQDTKDVTHTE